MHYFCFLTLSSVTSLQKFALFPYLNLIYYLNRKKRKLLLVCRIEKLVSTSVMTMIFYTG
ncbi:hypothetical protein CR492_11865 [Methylocella silvestris]|uniref:Uncharacterized protein n=1 Tax=Methylocella silvestris TaxID=199596 RepID=A0A2J7TGB9_METSI|nr:hypothetical protein CR492_11865 [Methylocella silvestris]